ncbi:uncharacterized protein MELLADRAFT_101015 [Melampsora larici-populina 98AG31]|uniref:Uncharacterized protein n=1 Tax=Melampsora larici-populina (strain 98AG31 / pathotype 3-4-7) TaxID=747676 RepID=F4R3C2_MELLP|nr:uncharacterized protein MELLADRAFT_101015 [Melampsora larici-populina 98AG31]EGG12602.1 hypothetical protein MELLADRAFT_101015 [Melampsora larici-populina 98AG31]
MSAIDDHSIDDESLDNTTVTEGSSTSSTTDSFGTVRQDPTDPLSSDNSKNQSSSTMAENAESRVFGDSIQKLDSVNKVRTRNHLTAPTDACEIIYDPFKCWSFLKSYHNRISEDKLEAVTKALYSCQISKSDSLTSFVDKFENLIREFYRLKGELSDIQSARMLLGAIPSLSIETKEYIHNTVTPLTREGVGSYLWKYEERHGWTCSAIKEVNSVSVRSTKKTSGECVQRNASDLILLRTVGPNQKMRTNDWLSSPKLEENLEVVLSTLRHTILKLSHLQ